MECPVCLEFYNQDEHAPHILPCKGAHEICKQCLAQLRLGNEDGFLCPSCREEIGVTARVNDNRGMLAALKALASKQQVPAHRPRHRVLQNGTMLFGMMGNVAFIAAILMASLAWSPQQQPLAFPWADLGVEDVSKSAEESMRAELAVETAVNKSQKKAGDSSTPNEALLAEETVPLVGLVDDGTEAQKEQAAHAQWKLAHDTAENATTQSGGIAPLVALVHTGTDRQKVQASAALTELVHGNTENQAAITQAGEIALLVSLLRDGTERQKELAAASLKQLSMQNSENQAAIALAGGIAPLVALLRDGTDGQKVQAAAAGALFELARDSVENQAAVELAGGIAPLVALVRAKSRTACSHRHSAR